MKKIALFLTACYAVTAAFAQTTGRLENLKDSWGTSYNYVGEIKNKMPNGLGVAMYSGGNTLRYAGTFLNGQFNGKGALVFDDGTFLSGNWKNGKLNGRGTDLNKDGDIYIGDFVEGRKEGNASYVYSDKSILVGSMKNDNYDGRCIYINANGTTVADNIYNSGKKNGTGYQYELGEKKLYEGEWAHGDWVSSRTATYNSFLKDSRFYAEKTDDQIIIGCIDRSKNDILQDTSFFYDLKNYKRYFGYCESGFLKSGIVVRDSTCFFGKMNTNGAYGACSLYKLKKYYDEGEYVNDYLDGSNSLSINLEKKTVYYGGAKEGSFTGTGWFVNSFNEVRSGSFAEGNFTGAGYIVFNTGKTIRGVFKDGTPTTVTAYTDENGAAIDTRPKSFETALNMVVGELTNDLVGLKGADDTDPSATDYLYAKKSLISFPSSVGANFIFEDDNFYQGFEADFYKGNSFQSAKMQYEKLCKDIAASTVHLKGLDSFKPGGAMEQAEESSTVRTKFTLIPESLSTFNVFAEINYKDGSYTVSLVAGDIIYED